MRQWARRALKAPLAAAGAVRQAIGGRPHDSGIAFLIYHRIDGTLGLELDLDAGLFARQLAYLAGTGKVIGYEQAAARLARGEAGDGPAYVLTFDDGYEDFYTRVFPLLKAYALPALLFVTTGFVEERVAYPLLAAPGTEVAPVTWDMLGEMAASGLVTLGAHTHTHPVLVGQPPDRVEEEIAGPLALFERRLGLRPRHFAYPRAEWDAATREVAVRYYETAAAGGGYRATAHGFDAYAIPRLPIRRSDGWLFFRAKLAGWLDGEERVYARLHRAAAQVRRLTAR